MRTGHGSLHGYRQHRKEGTTPCTLCKSVWAGYCNHLRLYGPRPKNGLNEVITDVVESNQPVAMSEVAGLVAMVRPQARAKSVRRVTYRLLDAGTLHRVDGRLVAT